MDISLPLLHDYDVKMPNFTFYGGRKQATTKLSSLSKLKFGPQKINLQGNLPDQFSFLGNRARYEFIELDMSIGLDLSIPRSDQFSFLGNRARYRYIELDMSTELDQQSI